MKIQKSKFNSRQVLICLLIFIATAPFLYLCGLVTQFRVNYADYMAMGGMLDNELKPEPVDFGLLSSYKAVFTKSGLITVLLLLAVIGSIVIYIWMYMRKQAKEYDERGFKISNDGSYGTAGWMSNKEMKTVLEVAPVSRVQGIILGEKNGNAVCMPQDTHLNKHIAIFGASGTMKSRAIIRPAIFQMLQRGESVMITDPKGELYADTSQMFKNNGYDVKVFNLVDPTHSDSWNCMDDLGGDTLLAQVLTNVIIGNTSSGKGDHFWDNNEGNLLKALILYVTENMKPETLKYGQSLPTVYNMLAMNDTASLNRMFENIKDGESKAALLPYGLFSQASDTVKAGVISGLGTRLQVLQSESVCKLTSRSDIDLTAPAQRKCAYYVITSDQDSTMAFLSSLFFSLFFIKLTRFADSQPGGKCPVPVNLILDEFNNIGRIGGAADGSDFAKTLSVIRSRDVRIMIAVQSLGQLQNRYPNNLWAEILGNCDIQLMLGCTDDVTAGYFSDRSGEITLLVDSTRTEHRTIALYEMIPKYQSTVGRGKRLLLTPDEVLRMPHDEMLAIIRGHNILKLRKLDYTKHPMSREIIKSSITDYIPAPYTPYVTIGDSNSKTDNPTKSRYVAVRDE